MLKKFLRYSSMNIIGMIGLSCYILADTFYIAKALGEKGLTALNFAIAVYSLIYGTGLMIGIGGATLFSVTKKSGNKVFTQSLITGIIFSGGMIFCGVFLSEDMALWLGADSSTIEYTAIYIRYILLFSPFYIVNNTVIAFVRNDGNPQLSMIAMLTSSFSNIILDYIFMFLLQWGMFGAVLATCFSPIINLLILSLHFIAKKNSFKVEKSYCYFSIYFMGKILLSGVSALIGELASAIALVIFNLILVKNYGNTAVASYGIIANVGLVITAVFTGIAQGTQPLASDSFGKHQNEILFRLLRYACMTALITAWCLYIFLLWKRQDIAEIFSNGNVVLESMATKGMTLYFIGIFFSGINIVATAFLSAVLEYKTATVISLARSCIILVPCVLLMNSGFGIIGVWLSFTVTEIIVFFVTLGGITKFFTKIRNKSN
ncbi:MAG: MATE family efflux transporter [Clostridia bacterium]|nr:MATE family efflux transporter [Clostridia bacterium]